VPLLSPVTCSAKATHVDLDFKIYSNVVWARFK